MNIENNKSPHLDLRITIYRVVKQIFFIVLLGLIIKYAFCDTALIKTDQMAPVIKNGDRVLLSKIRFVAPLKWLFHPHLNDPIIFRHPYFTKRTGCLRIAGKSGDSVIVHQGIFSIVNRPEFSFSQKQPEEETLPLAYSPRDNMPLFRIPKKKDTLVLDTLSIRDFIFCYSMIRQENPHNHYTLKPLLYIDDSLTNDYFIKDFTLFTGTFNAISDSLFTDWFFWDRLNAYLVSFNPDKKISLTFSLLNKQSPVTRYKIKKEFYFLLSDNWCGGYDSRYFGPVISTLLKGQVVGILWSFTPGVRGIRALQSRRTGKIIN